MKFKNIEVSGITRIIFNRKVEWEQKSKDGDWENLKTGEKQPHEAMMDVINILKHKPKCRMWSFGNTLNIGKNENPQKIRVSDIYEDEVGYLKTLVSKLNSMSRNRRVTDAYADEIYYILDEISGRI